MNEHVPVPAKTPRPTRTRRACPTTSRPNSSLLGAILSSNDVLDRVDDLIKPQHFHDPVHREIFTMAQARIAKGLATDANDD